MQRHVRRARRKAQPVKRLNEVSLFVKHLNAAACKGGAGELLADQEQLVNRIDRDGLTALRLIVSAGKYDYRAGLRRQIIELHAEIIFRRGACDSVIGID